MKINLKQISEEELWKYVGKHLADNGFDAVLVGGAVVSIYTDGAYQSGDLDFIIQNLSKEKLPFVMNKIGFIKTGKNYIHPDCNHLFVEFPSGPLGIGEDYNIKEVEEDYQGTKIKILSPTDCIKDRLASYIYWDAKECLDQAILVALAHKFNHSSVKRWCEGEQSIHVYKEFEKILKSRSNN
jgi:hypothetical protein